MIFLFSFRCTGLSNLNNTHEMSEVGEALPSDNLPEPDQGNVGISAVCATIEDAILSPRAHIAFSGGPMKAMLCLCSNSGSFGFSDACPQPAQTAYKKKSR